MSPLECWLNASKEATNKTVWLTAKNNGLVTETIFVNLENPEANELLANILRSAYDAKKSYELIVETSAVKRGKSGKLAVSLTLDTVLDTMTESVRRPRVEISDETRNKANNLLAKLASQKVVESSAKSEEADDLPW